jgi:hypothetical protein
MWSASRRWNSSLRALKVRVLLDVNEVGKTVVGGSFEVVDRLGSSAAEGLHARHVVQDKIPVGADRDRFVEGLLGVLELPRLEQLDAPARQLRQEIEVLFRKLG